MTPFRWTVLRLLLLTLALTTSLTLFPLPLRAAPDTEAGRASAEVKNDGMLGWQWANFLVLAGILGYYGWKLGRPYFSSHSQTIQKGLVEARERQTEAAKRTGEVEQKLTNLGEAIESFRQSVLAGQAAQVERMRRQAEVETERVRANAAQQIESVSKHERLELQRYASRLALDLAEQRARERMNPETQQALTGQFVSALKA